MVFMNLNSCVVLYVPPLFVGSQNVNPRALYLDRWVTLGTRIVVDTDILTYLLHAYTIYTCTYIFRCNEYFSAGIVLVSPPRRCHPRRRNCRRLPRRRQRPTFRLSECLDFSVAAPGRATRRVQPLPSGPCRVP